jgi:hypothetical protein
MVPIPTITHNTQYRPFLRASLRCCCPPPNHAIRPHQPLHQPPPPPQCNPSAIQFSNEISTAANLLRIVIYEHRTPPHIHALNLPPLLLLLLNNPAIYRSISFFRGLFDLQMNALGYDFIMFNIYLLEMSYERGILPLLPDAYPKNLTIN